MICHITVHTAQLDESVAFYQWLLEMPISRKLDRPGGAIVFLGSGETKLEFIADETAKSVDAKGLTVGFTVDDLDKKLAMLDDRKIPHSDIASPGPGIRFAFFTDLNGCAIQLVQEG